MVKLIKILSRILGVLLEWSFLLIILSVFAIRSKPVQTFLGRQVTSYLSSELNTRVEIGRVEIVFIDHVLLKDIHVDDKNKDTLARLETIHVKLKSFNLSKNEFVVKSAALRKGNIELDRANKTGTYNYQFLIDYFAGSKKTKKSSDAPTIRVESIAIDDIHFEYDDFRKKKSKFGMDFDHLKFENVHFFASNFSSKNGILGVKINRLSAKEKCGFNLRSLNTYCTVNPQKGLYFSNLKIKTSRSRIYAKKLNLISKPLSNFSHFVDRVTFDTQIDSSWIHMTDISYFAPTLEGMNDLVYLQANIKKKVKNLAINNLDLRFGSRSIIRGNLNLPDFRELKTAQFSEQLNYCLIDVKDIENFRLPNNAGKHLKLGKELNDLAYFDLTNTSFNGTLNQFILQSAQIKTAMGKVSIPKGLSLSKTNAGGYAFAGASAEKYDVILDSFQLGRFIKNDMLGGVKGKFDLNGVFGEKDNFRLTQFAGDVQYFGFNKYTYENITVENGSFEKNVVVADIKINDPNLQIDYSGKIDLKNEISINSSVNISKAALGKLHFSKDPNATLEANVKTINLKGTDPNKMSGELVVEKIKFTENGETVNVPELNLSIVRGSEDVIRLNSEIADATIRGKFDINTLPIAINNLIADVVPMYVSKQAFPKGKKDNNRLTAKDVRLKDLSSILAIYLPELKISRNAKLDFEYDGKAQKEYLTLIADQISYGSDSSERLIWYNNTLTQEIVDKKLDFSFKSNELFVNDSIQVSPFVVEVNGTNNIFETNVDWNKGSDFESNLNFNTALLAENGVYLDLHASHFSIRDKRWDITHDASLKYQGKELVINQLEIKRTDQSIKANGKVSPNIDDVLQLKVENLDLNELTHLLAVPAEITGKVNTNVEISKLFTDPMIRSDLNVLNLAFDKTEIGDILMPEAVWINSKEKFKISDESSLIYKGNETFNFGGNIYPIAQKENLDLQLKFKNTDLAILNKFAPSDVVSNIKGALIGEVDVTGAFDQPVILGQLGVSNTSAKIEMLGTSYTANGLLEFQDGDIAGIVPIQDQEGNWGAANISVSHQNFENLNINMEIMFDDYVNQYWGLVNWPNNTNLKPKYTGKFLGLNSKYKDGELFYGKAYAKGFANIQIQEQLTSITVNAKTLPNTAIDLPMYGSRNVGDYDFIRFLEDSLSGTLQTKTLGVEMDLNFDVTKDAKLRVLFNEEGTDAMNVTGNSPDMRITMNNFGDVQMLGTYTIDEGNYNLMLYGYPQEFKFNKGDFVRWTGDAANAELNITATASINADVRTLSPNLKADPNTKVLCKIGVSEFLSKPKLSPSIEIPFANSETEAVLGSINGNSDELNRQLVTLITLKSFAPLNHNEAGGINAASVAGDLINQKLKDFTSGSKTAVNVNAENAGSLTVGTIGLERAVSDRIIVRGDFGAQVGKAEQSVVADLLVEFLLRKDGTFKAVGFNKRNVNEAIGTNEKGDWTQGVSVQYSESFMNADESNIVVAIKNLPKSIKNASIYAANIFRKTVNDKPYKRKKRKAKAQTIPIAVTPEEVRTVTKSTENSIPE